MDANTGTNPSVNSFNIISDAGSIRERDPFPLTRHKDKADYQDHHNKLRVWEKLRGRGKKIPFTSCVNRET